MKRHSRIGLYDLLITILEGSLKQAGLPQQIIKVSEWSVLGVIKARRISTQDSMGTSSIKIRKMSIVNLLLRRK